LIEYNEFLKEHNESRLLQYYINEVNKLYLLRNEIDRVYNSWERLPKFIEFWFEAKTAPLLVYLIRCDLLKIRCT